MSSRRNQILAASAIWITVCGLGWHAFANILPRYGFFRKAAPSQQQRQQEWKDAQQAQEDFFKEKGSSKIWIKASTASKDARANISGTHEANGCFYYFGINQQLREIYCALSGAQRWQVSQTPDTGDRWDVRIKAPMAEKKEVPAAFLKYVKWTSKEMASALSGFKYVEGSPPPNPAAATAGAPGRRGGTIPPMPLSDARGMVANRINMPVQVDKPIRDRKPQQTDNLQVIWNLPPEKFVDQVASIYGVAVEKTTVETTSILVYDPKNAPQADMQRWYKDGKL